MRVYMSLIVYQKTDAFTSCFFCDVLPIQVGYVWFSYEIEVLLPFLFLFQCHEPNICHEPILLPMENPLENLQ